MDCAISGILPNTAMSADSRAPRSESGIGALMGWADRLWAVTYLSHGAQTGSGTGLYVIDEDLSMEQHPESREGTYTNRMIHPQTDQLVIGPHVVDADRRVRTVEDLLQDHEGRPNRLAATMPHLEEPDSMVYTLTMEGLLYELDVETLDVTLVADLVEELELAGGRSPSHFKGGWAHDGRVVVTNNTYDEHEYTGARSDGRLAEWTGPGDEWTVLEEKPFMDVAGRTSLGSAMFANGWDNASAILKVYHEGEWSTYRLPKASHTYDHMWTTEWMRIREVEHERFLMDTHGMYYEFPPYPYDGSLWGVKPICAHARVVPDFCNFRGYFVQAGDQATPSGDSNLLAGQASSNLVFGKTDDLWSYGKPAGWGGPWRETDVTAGEPSDPFLMTGFDQKVVHLTHDASSDVACTIEVDFLGDGSWERYRTIEVSSGGYEHHEFPAGFSAHWVRVTANKDCTATAHFVYS